MTSTPAKKEEAPPPPHAKPPVKDDDDEARVETEDFGSGADDSYNDEDIAQGRVSPGMKRGGFQMLAFNWAGDCENNLISARAKLCRND